MIMEINYYYYLLLPYFNLVVLWYDSISVLLCLSEKEKREREHKMKFQ